MYAYNLIVKRGDLDNDAANVEILMQLTRRFGPDVHFNVTSLLDNEIVAIVRHESKRNLQATLGEWFTETNRTLEGEGDEAAGRPSSYPVGTLLHYREITPDEPIYNQLGG